ncbi:hypothetical protein A2U01_0106049, partial [Trifolium medium]|nr:hypothetical protein [Trifolium medium]
MNRRWGASAACGAVRWLDGGAVACRKIRWCMVTAGDCGSVGNGGEA